jgi:hypothetical protein
MIPRRLPLFSARNYGLSHIRPAYHEVRFRIAHAIVLALTCAGFVLFMAYVVRPILRMVWPHA